MIAYYIHWSYPPEADDELYYGGPDDFDNLFHHKENVEQFAKDEMKRHNDDEIRYNYINQKDDKQGLTPEEKEEFTKLLLYHCGNYPNDYTVCEKEFKFKDEI